MCTSTTLSSKTPIEEGENMGVIRRFCNFFLMCTHSPSQSTNQTSQIPLPTQEEDSQPVQVLLPHLPAEILIQILSRLPVKSLLRFRCVSKSWRSLISNHEFTKTHLSLASSIDYARHRFLITRSFAAVVMSCSLYSFLNHEHHNSDHVVELDYPLRGGGPTGVRVLGCCDGLMCIETKTTLFLWNPSTRKYKRLPSYNLPPSHEAVYGFGYDASTGDYKLVRFLYEGRGGICYGAKMFTLRSDSWRRIGDFPRRDIPFGHHSGVFVNGALHWNARVTNGIIVSLDLAKETYGEVWKPEDRDGRLYETLCDFSGCLGILCGYRTCADVWVMKKYGTRESWTKLVVVPYDTRSCSSDITYTAPICVLKNGEVLLYTNERLSCYNPKDGTFSYPTSPINLEYSTVHPYIESLVSVDMDADKGIPWKPEY